MASARQHLANFHKGANEHHGLAASEHAGLQRKHAKIAAIHLSLHKADGLSDGEDGPHARLAAEHDGAAEHHAQLAKSHTAQMNYHATAAEECAKAMDGDLNKLVPTAVSAIAPESPRLVKRPGQPEPAALPVPLEFEKLVTD